MYTFDIIFKNNNPAYKEWASDCHLYVCFLERPGLVLQRDHLLIQNKKGIKIPVACPEKDSLALKNHCQYALNIIHKIEIGSGCQVEFVLTGKESESPRYGVPTNSSYYILRYGWSSPLLCGDTHHEIPLYKIPCTDHHAEDYDNVFFWNNTYQKIYSLWFDGLYEPFAEQELQDPRSKINAQGRALCQLIEALTDIPTYYFLFNNRDWTVEEDRLRKCPITGSDWLIKDSIYEDFISFKCDESRLVSELSANCSDI